MKKRVVVSITIGFIVIAGVLYVRGLAAGGHLHHLFGHNTPAVGGQATLPEAGARAIDVVATEFAFHPAVSTVRAGETVNLRLINHGHVVHNITFVSRDLWLSVPAGQSIASRFRTDQPGQYEFYCTEPGHREAGMVGHIIVTP